MRRLIIFQFLSLSIVLLSGLTCEAFEEIPGQRVPIGDVSKDYWIRMDLPLQDPLFLDASVGLLAVASADSIAVSTDGGDTWERSAMAGINALIVDNENASRILVLSDKKIFISQDRGASFTEHQTPEPFVAVVPHPSLSTHLLAVSDTALWRSYDNGVSWQKIYTPPESPKLSHLAIDLDDTSYVYIIDAGGLRISSDGGKKWNSKNYFEGDSVTHLRTSNEGLFIGTGGFIRFSAEHGDAESWLTYAPYFSEAPELADFLPVDAQTIIYACFNEDPGEYQAYITKDLNVHWANASPGLLGWHGGLKLAGSGKTYYALVASEQSSFLYKFNDTELWP
jgi:photosystem II stability/assembly factor-like uncharacterized protein